MAWIYLVPHVVSGPQTPAPDDRLATLDRRLEHLEMLVGFTVAEPLRKLREEAGVSDKVDAAILRLTSDWTAAAEIETLTGAGDSTVKQHFKRLVAKGALELAARPTVASTATPSS